MKLASIVLAFNIALVVCATLLNISTRSMTNKMSKRTAELDKAHKDLMDSSERLLKANAKLRAANESLQRGVTDCMKGE